MEVLHPKRSCYFDHEYDLLFKQLQAIETAHPELISADSPSQRVATDLITSFNTVKHIVPMLSLENSYNEEDLKDFDAQIKTNRNPG